MKPAVIHQQYRFFVRSTLTHSSCIREAKKMLIGSLIEASIRLQKSERAKVDQAIASHDR